MERRCTGRCLANQMRIDALNLAGAAIYESLLPTQQSIHRAVGDGERAEAILDAADAITQCNGEGNCGASVEVPA